MNKYYQGRLLLTGEYVQGELYSDVMYDYEKKEYVTKNTYIRCYNPCSEGASSTYTDYMVSADSVVEVVGGSDVVNQKS